MGLLSMCLFCVGCDSEPEPPKTLYYLSAIAGRRNCLAIARATTQKITMENPKQPEHTTGRGSCASPFTAVCQITLEKAFKVLEECSALSMADGELLYPSLSALEGSDENEFAYFEWVNEEGLIFSAKFAEGENQLVTVMNNLMTLVDIEGDEVTFYVLGPMVIKEFLSSLPNESSAGTDVSEEKL